MSIMEGKERTAPLRKLPSYKSNVYGEHVVTYEGHLMWSFYENDTGCCGVVELHKFGFGSRKVSQEVFNTGCDLVFDGFQGESAAYGQLTLTRDPKEKKCYQPRLEAYLLQKEGAFCSPWRKNPNTNNEIQVWLVQV